MPAFHKHKEITWSAYVDESDQTNSFYDIIIGRDMMFALGIDINFSSCSMIWGNAEVPMQEPQWLDKSNVDQFEEELFMSEEPAEIGAEQIQEILDAKYAPADLPAEIAKLKHLTAEQRDALLHILRKFEALFDGSLGCWNTAPVELELKDPKCKPVHAKPYPVPQSQVVKLKAELKRNCELGIMRKVNRSEWASPAFIIKKPDGTLRSLADNRLLNQRLKRYPYPLPKIQEMLQKLEGFQWATSLDLNMGYYHIKLSSYSSSLCTVIFPWGKYEYLRLPMGLCNAPDIFQ